MQNGSPTLPDFIVIGAAKAATTWLQVQLQANSAVYMPDPEPHFFTREFDRGAAHYAQWFAQVPDDVTVIGEKSADYLADPDAPARIASMLPDVRLVVQLRDPVERAYSDYKMFYRRGTISGPPEEYLASPDNPHPRFLLDGLYGRHLSRWLDVFPRDQVHVLRYEDVLSHPRQTIEQVCRHIGAPSHFDAGLADRPENSSHTRILPLPVRTLLAPLKDVVKPLRGKGWFESARSLLAREISYPPLRPDLRKSLERFYADDIALVQELTGVDTSGWCRTRHALAA